MKRQVLTVRVRTMRIHMLMLVAGFTSALSVTGTVTTTASGVQRVRSMDVRRQSRSYPASVRCIMKTKRLRERLNSRMK